MLFKLKKFLQHKKTIFLKGRATLLLLVVSLQAKAEIKGLKSTELVTMDYVLKWTISLAVVLLLFVLLVWLLKKSRVLTGSVNSQMRVLGGLSLGMREKLVLVQVGEQKIVLAVTPGKIEKLLTIQAQSDNQVMDEIDGIAQADYNTDAYEAQNE